MLTVAADGCDYDGDNDHAASSRLERVCRTRVTICDKFSSLSHYDSRLVLSFFSPLLLHGQHLWRMAAAMAATTMICWLATKREFYCGWRRKSLSLSRQTAAAAGLAKRLKSSLVCSPMNYCCFVSWALTLASRAKIRAQKERPLAVPDQKLDDQDQDHCSQRVRALSHHENVLLFLSPLVCQLHSSSRTHKHKH